MSPNRWRSCRVLKSILVDLVDDLPQQRAGLHVVVGILESRAAGGQRWRVEPAGQVLEAREEVVVDEVDQLVAGDAFGVGGPIAPAEAFGEWATCSCRG